MKVKLTPSQDLAKDKINSFLNVPVTSDLSTRVFRITGAAGTGKSFLMKYALSDMLNEDAKGDFGKGLSMLTSNNVIGVTVSHKAKNILSKSIPNCTTFASCFGLKPNYHPNGSVSYTKQKYTDGLHCDYPYKVFVHDEFSLYGEEEYAMTLKETHPESKIIFVGDIFQNPPIRGNDQFSDLDSPIQYLELPSTNYAELTEIVRQEEDNPIIKLATMFREEISGNQDIMKLISLMKDPILNEDGEGFSKVAYSDFLGELKNGDLDNSRIIVYRNKTVDFYNEAIRNFILNNPNSKFIKGETIYMNNSFMVKKNRRVVAMLYNSEEYKIKEINKGYSMDIPCLLLTIESKGTDLPSSIDITIPVPYGHGEVMFTDKLKQLTGIALNPRSNQKQKSAAWKAFYEYKENFADVSYAYCYNGHKSQGSTIETVYIDINDILSVGPLSSKRKLQAIYTAITRASKNVIFLTSKK